MVEHVLIKKTRFIRENMRHAIHGFLTEYETPKIVAIHSSTFAVLLRVMQTIILIYSVVYLLLYEKGYQKSDTAIISSTTLKVKGIGYIKSIQNATFVIDGADYIIPPSENNAIFIMTNFIRTDQTRSRCAESVSLEDAICYHDDDCKNRPYIASINGLWTGRCLLPKENRTTPLVGRCEMEGWCPAENDLSSPMLVKNVLNFTIFVKNFIEFPTFNVKHKNMVDNLKPCIHHPVKEKNCPIFTMKYIINEAETDEEERDLMLRYGGVIRMKLDWDCNLDRNIKFCQPIYSFARLDVPFREKPFSVGYNFRHASRWKYNGIPYRTLTKVFGLRLIIAVSGKAGKFDFITLTLNTGSLVGIFGLATFFCDIILLHLSKRASTYRSHIFESVHLKTRCDSLAKSTETDRNSSPSSTETPPDERKSTCKTIAVRPLTVCSKIEEN